MKRISNDAHSGSFVRLT